MTRFAKAAALWFALASVAAADSYPETKAIVTVGGPVTDIVYAMGEEHRIIARANTSVYPAAANQLLDVGYMRRRSAEVVWCVGPDLIVARDISGPPEALDRLREAVISIFFTKHAFFGDAVL